MMRNGVEKSPADEGVCVKSVQMPKMAEGEEKTTAMTRLGLLLPLCVQDVPVRNNNFSLDVFEFALPTFY